MQVSVPSHIGLLSKFSAKHTWPCTELIREAEASNNAALLCLCKPCQLLVYKLDPKLDPKQALPKRSLPAASPERGAPSSMQARWHETSDETWCAGMVLSGCVCASMQSLLLCILCVCVQAFFASHLLTCHPFPLCTCSGQPGKHSHN